MSTPALIYFVEWHDMFRDRDQERKFRSETRAAKQVAAILAAPDDVVYLKGVYVTSGWDVDRIHWTTLDPATLIATLPEDTEPEFDTNDVSPAEHHRRITEAWDHHAQLVEGPGVARASYRARTSARQGPTVRPSQPVGDPRPPLHPLPGAPR